MYLWINVKAKKSVIVLNKYEWNNKQVFISRK